MFAFIIRRILQFIPTVIGISFIMFVLLNVLPGSAALMTGGKEILSPEIVKKLEKKWGLDKPFHVRYLNYMVGLAKGDLGTSFIRGDKVRDIIGNRLWPTLKLAVAALAIACFIGIPLGFYSAVKQGTWVDTVTMVGAVSGVSMPQFWSALLLMYLFSVVLRWLPTFGYGNGDLKNLILPAVTLGIGYMALLARTTRAAVVEVLSQDYIRTAHAKGLSVLFINGKHVFRNTMVLILTTIGMQFGSLMGETVVVETVFSWPGIGSLMVDSIFLRDTPVTQGCIMLIIFVFMSVNLSVDILYSVVDPRIRYD
ncbi:MAG: ABC transporter permease [Desulfobacteraceae bacterium]|nr:ABC transporter permease [Desulfobacteraceae bacterium]